MARKPKKTAIFLGAGASAAEGAPVQNHLFKEYFKSVSKLPSSKDVSDGSQKTPLSPQVKMRLELSQFFRLIFGINVEVSASKLDTINFPTFEEALGILDLAEIRRESLRQFDLEPGSHGNRIDLVRQFMIMAMAKAIADNLQKVKGLHRTLTSNLHQQKLLPHTTFISTNYDILIDNALLHVQSPEIPGEALDYGVDFTNFDLPKDTRVRNRIWHRPSATAVRLFKLHGSLNWLYCSTCNALTLTPGMKGVIKLIERTHLKIAQCQVCKTFMSPIIVPPTFYKDMSRVFLSVVWNKAEYVLRQADHVIFCGYSFPDADIHLKYLLKRVQTNRPDDKPLRFTVINHRPGKNRRQAREEADRFQRFLGISKVKYTKSSFEQFAKDPKKFYNWLRVRRWND